ncbi:MAG: serine/threonine-protein phosphatase [Ignavibacteriae bacterium]|nr:serine/threonine-protein phosphatase [Ignavibacteria bacterium]MBI3363317.1 serine/threonine-protein phosphatase [Ignavibacteriota bacterium]
MQLRKLYRTIETIGSQKFESDEELLQHVLSEIVRNEEISIKGGRIWKFDPRSAGYELVHQIGDMDPIKAHYKIKLKDYPIFLELPKVRTVLASENDQYLRKRGILKYSATGVGEKIQWRSNALYRYVMAFNADHLGESVTSTLNIISAALSSVLRSRKIERQAKVLERDLDKASEIQRSILPQHEMHFHAYEIYGVSMADRLVGGDFFDYLQIEGDTERIGIVIGDATSKGLSAAVEALYVSGALRMGFQFQTKISVLLSRVNKLVNKTFTEEHFVSLFYTELTDDKNGLVLYANCGHNNPILLRGNSDQPELLEATGQVLGPFPNETYKTESILMNREDVLLLYTDGISEATNEKGEFYGEDRLFQRILEARNKSAREITQHILEDVQIFNSSGTQSDDKTIVAIKRNG